MMDMIKQEGKEEGKEEIINLNIPQKFINSKKI
jgi:hypothetical protein